MSWTPETLAITDAKWQFHDCDNLRNLLNVSNRLNLRSEIVSAGITGTVLMNHETDLGVRVAVSRDKKGSGE